MAFDPAFSLTEATDLAALMAVFADMPPPPVPGPTEPPYPLTTPTPPVHWSVLFTSGQIGPFDNRWQLARDTSTPGRYAILIRGTVEEAGSILDDLLSVMIPATGDFGFLGVDLDYQLARDPKAAVHLGFMLALYLLLYEPGQGIIDTLAQHCPGGSDIFIAGHSQGAAIGTLARSFFEYAAIPALQSYRFKMYVYAPPKPGNDHYSSDFESAIGSPGMGFRILNSQDWVPQVPFTIQLPGDINAPNPVSTFVHSMLYALFTGFNADVLREAVKAGQLIKHRPSADWLRAVLVQRGHPVAADPSVDLGSAILPTFNFVDCGNPVAMDGVPGVNPCTASDSFWQHHMQMYYLLLTGGAVPSTCPT